MNVPLFSGAGFSRIGRPGRNRGLLRKYGEHPCFLVALAGLPAHDAMGGDVFVGKALAST